MRLDASHAPIHAMIVKNVNAGAIGQVRARKIVFK